MTIQEIKKLIKGLHVDDRYVCTHWEEDTTPLLREMQQANSLHPPKIFRNIHLSDLLQKQDDGNEIDITYLMAFLTCSTGQIHYIRKDYRPCMSGPFSGCKFVKFEYGNDVYFAHVFIRSSNTRLDTSDLWNEFVRLASNSGIYHDFIFYDPYDYAENKISDLYKYNAPFAIINTDNKCYLVLVKEYDGYYISKDVKLLECDPEKRIPGILNASNCNLALI